MGQTRKKKDSDTSITRNIDEMLPFVQIPSKTNSLNLKVKELIVKKIKSDEEITKEEGKYFNAKGMKIIDEDIDVYREDENGVKHLLAKLRKNVIPSDMLELGWRSFYKTAAPSRNRGAAAGPIDLKSQYWKKRKPVEVDKWGARYMQDGKVSKMRVNNNVFSSVLGYFEETPFMGLPCRLTSYTQKYFDQYKNGIPFLQTIDGFFKKLVPGPHAKQLAQAKKRPEFQIENTAFSSLTMNRNFRTALHKDAGDFQEGFGNLTVLEYGKYSGGETLFPQYGIGFNVRAGDFLAMDVHQWHTNSELYETASQKEYNKKLPKIYENDESTGTLGQDKPFSRISFVCYLREKLVKCDPKKTVAYYKRVGFDPEKGTLSKKKPTQTRKKSKGKQKK